MHWTSGVALIAFALLLQVSANLVNDLYDFLQGADTKERLGPPRALQKGWISPCRMRRGIVCTFGLALVPGIYLLQTVGWWACPIVVVAMGAAWFYTAGTHSLAYLGLGDLAAFVFFGPVALLGSYYVETLHSSHMADIASLSSGCLAVALLTANHLRDHIVDEAAHKKTWVVRWGLTFGRCEYGATLLLATLLPALVGVFSTLSLIPLVFWLARRAFREKDPIQLAPLLPQTATFLWIYTFLWIFENALS